jgi:fumarylacetoacetase
MASNPFPVDNLPFGIISTAENVCGGSSQVRISCSNLIQFKKTPRPATIIDSTVIDLSELERHNAFNTIPSYPSSAPLQETSLNAFAALPKNVRSRVRRAVQHLWTSTEIKSRYPTALLPASSTTNHLPMVTQNYTDYVSSRGHFENVSQLFTICCMC